MNTKDVFDLFDITPDTSDEAIWVGKCGTCAHRYGHTYDEPCRSCIKCDLYTAMPVVETVEESKECASCVYEKLPGNEAPCKLCINHNHFLPIKSCTTCKHGDLREDEGVCAECNGQTHYEPDQEFRAYQNPENPAEEVASDCEECEFEGECGRCINYHKEGAIMDTLTISDEYDEPFEENPGCIDCIYRERAPDDEPCEDCIDFSQKRTVHPSDDLKASSIEEPMACSNCVNAELSSTSDQCFRCKDYSGYIDARKLNAAIDEATDDQQSCHRCIHIGMGFNSTSKEGACADCEEHSHFKQNARQIVFASQVGGSHYKNPDVPEGFPDPAEFCIMHGLGGAETAVVKYVFRHNRKDGVKDLKKAKQYIEFIAACRYNEII